MVKRKLGSIRTGNEKESDFNNSPPKPLFPSIPMVILLLVVGVIFGYVFHSEISKVVNAVSEIKISFSQSPKIVKEVKEQNKVENEEEHVFENAKYAKNYENFENDPYDAELQKLKEKYKILEQNQEHSQNQEQSNIKTEKVEEIIFEDDDDITEEEYMRIRREAGVLKKEETSNKKRKPELKKVERNEDLMESEIEELDMNHDSDEEQSVDNDVGNSKESPETQKEHDFDDETSKSISDNNFNDSQTRKTISKGDSEDNSKTFVSGREISAKDIADESVTVEDVDIEGENDKNSEIKHVTFDSLDAREGWTVSGDENIIKFGGRNSKKYVNLKVDQDSMKNKGKSESAKNKVNQDSIKNKATNKQNSVNAKLKKETDSKTANNNDKSKSRSKHENLKEKQKQKDGVQDTSSESLKNDPNLPDEIKNFKATFQKTLTPKKTFIDGRRVPAVELLPQKETNSSVKVYLFDEFLSEEEADGLIKAHDAHVKQASQNPPILCFDSVNTLQKHLKDAKKKIRISPKDFTEGTTCVNQTFSAKLKKWLHGNWSYSTAFYPGESRFSSILAFRINNAMGLKPSHGGKFQLTSYPIGKAYKTHTDCNVGSIDKRDRMASVLIYLNTVKDGGKTEFPGIWVKPRKGRALLWNNMNSDGVCEETSRHEAAVVKKGQKYILIRWYYYQNFYSLGKRPEEPNLPKRKEGQPRVSCDEYNNGSCRWYDEWGYDHLLDYQQQKLTLI
ncbi:hypothetical protein LOTGIDRAFT_172228 [Lottia gigantea]|uniref:Fe2OG dioxygenase domain-containing protein n=1 Tax=Lottia gigantea TaxID=225164 RepID=V4B8S0_LOTGI|nr:hypothetical protein LOTGIDRAFT_172228 [Lottia gigantea]ESP02232.1 hypothetical protein LOTGIDRAFT_172228 [Lottia gigantea]